jgi:hypothetical protein
MPSLDRRIGSGVFEPEQLTALRQLFEEASTLFGASTDSAEADDIALKVLTAFKSGYVDKETMFAALLDAKEKSSPASRFRTDL